MLDVRICVGLLVACSPARSIDESSSSTTMATETSTGDGDGDANCGDAIVGVGEECDLGPENGETGPCTPECTIAECGDGYLYEGSEGCDDANDDNTDACVGECQIAVCGDGHVQDGVEECDDANDDETDGCTSMCTPGVCGDGIVQATEQCDDGNSDTSDGCPACQLAFCGDSHVQAGIETCDDGNMANDDACIGPSCVPAECGDGELWAGMEGCDDGNDDNGDGCPGSCQPASCGDGYRHAGVEECDDGNEVGDDGCTNDCVAEYCFHFDNTEQVDLMGIGWFDDCVDAPGDNVRITVRDVDNQVVYEGSGAKVGMWTYDQLTSTAGLDLQYEVYDHDRIITLDNGHLLRISGRNANGNGCGGSLGNGYVIATYDAPLFDVYHSRIKLLVSPYNYTVGGIGARTFGNWSTVAELSWNDGGDMFSCFPFFGPGPELTGFLGSIAVHVY